MSEPTLDLYNKEAIPQDVYNSFISRLSDEDLVAFDNATVDLSEAVEHPDFLKHPLEARRKYVREYLMSQVAPMKDIFRGLAPEHDNQTGEAILQQILGPPSFQQTVGRQIYDAGVPITTGIGGALGAAAGMGAGGAGSIPGAMVGGGMGYLAGDYLLRKMTDLPDPSLGDRAGQTGLAMLGQGADQGVFNFMSKAGEAIIGGPVKSFMLGKNFTLTPAEHQSMLDLQQGSTMLGRTNTPEEATLTAGQLMTNRGTPNAGTTFENFMRNSFGGRNISTRQLTRNREAMEAVQGRYVNSIHAVNDPRQAAEIMVTGTKNATRVAAQARRDAYGALGTMTRDIPTQNSESLLAITNQRTRPDIEFLHAHMNKDIPDSVADNLTDLLTTKIEAPLSTLPPGTIQPGAQVNVQGNQVTYHGPGQTPGMSLVALDPLSSPQQIRTDMVTVSHITPEASYANLDQFSSLMGGIVRAGEEAAKGSGRGDAAENLIAASRTAAHLKRQAEAILSNMNIPAEVREARDLVRKIYAEENDTFYTPLIQGLMAKFKDSPDKFAATLLHPNNSDDLTKIHKAIDSMPRFSAATITDPVERQLALGADSVYTTGSRYWNQHVRPQLQAELLREQLMTPQAGVSGNLNTWERMVQASPNTLTPDFIKENLFSLNAAGLLQKFHDMTPATRAIIFGSETIFQRYYQVAETLKKAQTGLGESGSMLMQIRQSGSATTLAGAAGGIVSNQATGNPVKTAIAASLGIVMPPYLARKMTDAAFTRRLIFGIKNPSSSTAKRFFAEMTRDMARIATAAGGEWGSTRPGELSIE